MDKDRLIDLVQKTKEHDEAAFEELFKAYYPSVYKAAFKLCHNDADAQDIAQLTFLQVRKSIHNLEKPAYFPLWINRICVNKCKNLFRDNKSDLYDDEYVKYFNQVTENRREYISEALSHYTSDQKVLNDLILSLSKEHQDIIKYLYYQECSQEEVAELLNIPIGTVKSRAYAARKALRCKVEDYETREQVKLNFYFSQLPMLFTLYFLQKQSSWIKGLAVIKPSFHEHLKSLMSKISLNYAICACGCVLALSAAGIYHEYQKPNTVNRVVFPLVSIDTYTITNEQDAYYLLRNYAYDEKALQVISDQLILEMETLYEALKQCNGSYYHVLVECGWSYCFENRLKNI